MATTTTVKKAIPYIDWSAIIAGTVAASAISLVLIHFGNGLGFTYEQLTTTRELLWEHYIIVAMWALWVQLMASMGGAYIAGRSRRPWSSSTSHESEVRDGGHGLMVWALGTLVAAAAVAVAGFLSAATGADTAVVPAMPVDMARRLNVIWGFSLAASSLVSAAAAWWTATLGGDHRDQAVDATAYISFRTRVKK